MPTENVIRPQPGPQSAFITTKADIAIRGGGAGGGKTRGLLFECLRHVDEVGLGAVIFRREYPQITNEGGLWISRARSIPGRRRACDYGKNART